MVTTNDRPLTRQTDQLLAEIAARIQLSPSRYRQATERYQTVADWLERDGSPLKGKVAQLYPQGSMAIGAAILSRNSDDQYDIDIALELTIPQDTSPKYVLDILFQVVKGEPGSRYYDMTRRRSRCVTIEYSDMHLDLTPMVRRPGTLEREGWIFENRSETPNLEKRLIANPHGFAEWFNELTHRDGDAFADAFRSIAKSYDISYAEQEPVPEYEDFENKSQPTVVLQLVKQWRNVQYQGVEDKGPPSVLLSRIVAKTSNPMLPLSNDLALTAHKMAEFIAHHRRARLLITNPVCPEDVLTDRWQLDQPEAQAFIEKLLHFESEIGLLSSGKDLSEAKKILATLFGEYPTRNAVDQYGERVGEAIRSNQTSHNKVTASVVVPAGSQAGLRVARPTQPHQFHKPPEL